MTDATAPVKRSDEPRVVFISAASRLAGDWRWVEETADLYDVVHWHDDVQGLTVAQARDLVRALRAAEKPLVLSVPPDVLDTALPRLGGEERIDAFSVLIPAAAVLLARDGGSAEAVWRAWGRSCLVVAEGEEDTVSANLYRAIVGDEGIVPRTDNGSVDHSGGSPSPGSPSPGCPSRGNLTHGGRSLTGRRA